MEIAAIIISLLALLVSIAVAYVESNRDYRLSKITLEFEFYREIFKDHLIKSIPEARHCLRIDRTNHLRDFEPLVDELNKIIQDSVYFRYNNKEFYYGLKENVQQLEDYLVDMSYEELVSDKKTSFYKQLNKRLDVIYKTISDAYLGR